jgi:hypothetical protein
MKKITTAMLAALALFVALFSAVAEARNLNPGVMPINSHSFGKSYGVWGGEFSSWIWSFSPEEFPLDQPDGNVDCGNGQSGKVWFLYGAFTEGVHRACTIPPGKALFISVNSVLSMVPLFGTTEEEIRADAAAYLDGVETLEVSVDGVPINDPWSYRASSPEGGFVFTIREGSILDLSYGLPPGDYYPAIVDGYFIMLPPLSRGQHTVQWASSGVYQDGTPYSYSMTWDLTIAR